MKTICKYCAKSIDNRGMDNHTHFKHLRQYLVEFRLNPIVCYVIGTWPPRFEQHQLTQGETK
jgi:hypothetical protein